MTQTIPDTMQAVAFDEPGGPDVLKPVTCPTPSPGAGEVLVKVTAAGVNGPDLVQRRGHYPPPKGASPLLGLEVSGTIVATDSAVTDWQVGDQVCALTNGGGYADYVAVNSGHCLEIPGGVDVVDAAGLPETYFTVWSNIFQGQTIPEGGNFLVHGGSGGIGSTAVQLGTAMGLNVYTTVPDDEAAAFVTDLGATRAINYTDEDFVPILRDAGGADIVLDIIGGDYIARNIKASRHDGRIVQIAFNAGSKVQIDLMPVMLKRLTFTGSTLRSRPDASKTAIAADLARIVWPLFAKGDLRPVTHRALALKDASEAHRLMESAEHMGKLLLLP
ncbi:MAG: NAD(P)H-quinone oxidoreductase [Silicimonas sp.]|nr:NAD(P)H-quinone oxidoreductase [Silicimonas sp.]